MHGDGVIVNLRGVNLHPGQAPEDMIPARLWPARIRLIGPRRHPMRAIPDLPAAMRERVRIIHDRMMDERAEQWNT